MKSLSEVKESIHAKRWSVGGLKVSRKSLFSDESVPEAVRQEALEIIDALIKQRIDWELGINRSFD